MAIVHRRKKVSKPAPPRTLVEVIEDVNAGTEELYQRNLAVEVTEAPKTATPFYPQLLLPHCVIRVSKIGISFDYRMSKRLAIAQHVEADHSNGANAYILYQREGFPVYAYQQHDDDSQIIPIRYPEQREIKTSSVDLYAKAVTYKMAITRILRRKLKKNNDTVGKTAKLVWIIGLIVVVLFMILMITVSILGADDNSPAPVDTGGGVAAPAAETHRQMVIDTTEKIEPVATPPPAKGVPVE